MIETRQKRLAQLKSIANNQLLEGKSFIEVREVLDRHMLKHWALSYNARLDYLHTIQAWLE